MRILAFIENPEIIKEILKHPDLWDLKARPPPHKAAEIPSETAFLKSRFT